MITGAGAMYKSMEGAMVTGICFLLVSLSDRWVGTTCPINKGGVMATVTIAREDYHKLLDLKRECEHLKLLAKPYRYEILIEKEKELADLQEKCKRLDGERMAYEEAVHHLKHKYNELLGLVEEYDKIHSPSISTFYDWQKIMIFIKRAKEE